MRDRTAVLYMLLFSLFRLNYVYNNVIPMLIIHEILPINETSSFTKSSAYGLSEATVDAG